MITIWTLALVLLTLTFALEAHSLRRVVSSQRTTIEELVKYSNDLAEALGTEWELTYDLRRELSETRQALFIEQLRASAAKRALNLEPLTDEEVELLMNEES